MSDTAAFFANKKKKKKTFKFNANLIDANAVSNRDHIEAPAISSASDNNISNNAAASSFNNVGSNNESSSAPEGRNDQWDEEALTSAVSTSANISGPSRVASTEVKTLQAGRGRPDNIANKLRLQETKAQLAAAREGMERQAAKLEEEKRQKEEQAKKKQEEKVTGGKWVSSRIRTNFMQPAMPGGKLDVSNEELFPDLAAADKILEGKTQQQQAKFAKKTPVGGGATWASKMATNNKAKKVEQKAKREETVSKDEKEISKDGNSNNNTAKKETASAEPAKSEPEVVKDEIENPTAAAAVKSSLSEKKSTASTGTKLKKKKKDLSTFKAS